MRAPFCSESTDLCPEERDIIRSENENGNEIHAIEQSLERSRVNKTAVFGICLDDLMGTSLQVAPQIPFILSRICTFIEKHGMHERSLFANGEEKIVENLRLEFTESGDAPLENAGHIASIAKLLIIFLEELPEPLIPVSSQSDFIKDMEKLSLNPTECLSSLKTSLEKLPDSAYQVLKYLSRFLLRVTFHKEYNGMSSVHLAVIFGPLIFRPSSNDQQIMLTVQDIVNCFVKDYRAIFENSEEIEFQDYVVPSHKTKPSKLSRQPCPSSVMPVMSLSPLSVVIPTDEDSDIESKKANVPILLIEGQLKMQSKIKNDAFSNNDNNNSTASVDISTSVVAVTRKRKERRFSGEDPQQRSSSEERPSPNSLVAVGTVDIMRRCNSHEEVMEYGEENKEQSKTNSKDFKLVGSYVSNNLDLIMNGNNLSPHPPTAKRREIEVNPDVDINDSWQPTRRVEDKNMTIQPTLFNEIKQNSIAESSKPNIMDCDTLDESSNSVSIEEHEILHSTIGNIPRSNSCPIPKSDNSNSSSSESENLSLSWSMLFEDDSEPVRAEPHLSLSKRIVDDETLLSPSVQHLRQSDYYEAPLSPSAYRSYLSYRNTHLDPSVPPSPPVEQEDFAKKLVESSSVSDSIKQLTKKIHSIKKKIRKYDEKFEAEFGFKPSHAEKSNNCEAKKMLNDLYKARKELKGLKEEAHLEQVGTSFRGAAHAHILEDTTNQFSHETSKTKTKSCVEDFVGMTMKTLSDDRKTANRPEAFDDMSNDQVKDEKLAIQKALLNFEKIHGKPMTREQRETCRPLYERYRCVKRLLVRSGSFAGSSKNKELCSELQPILEHETMDFPARQQKSLPMTQNVLKTTESTEDLKVESSEKIEIKEEQNSSNFLAMKYDNSNLHELPLSEMLFRMQNIKSEKRRLRKILKDFETEFFKLNKRKVQKEDKVPMESFYSEYKHIKARLRLLEALISKHDQHQLM